MTRGLGLVDVTMPKFVAPTISPGPWIVHRREQKTPMEPPEMEWPFIWSVAISSSSTPTPEQVRSACSTPTCPGGTPDPQKPMSIA